MLPSPSYCEYSHNKHESAGVSSVIRLCLFWDVSRRYCLIQKTYFKCLKYPRAPSKSVPVPLHFRKICVCQSSFSLGAFGMFRGKKMPHGWQEISWSRSHTNCPKYCRKGWASQGDFLKGKWVPISLFYKLARPIFRDVEGITGPPTSFKCGL